MKIKLTKSSMVGDNESPYLIAELGSNHNGDMELARKLIYAAKEAGADCVKFQSWSKDSIFSKKVYKDNYFLADDYRDRDDYTLEQIVDKYSISEHELLDMKQYADEIGIDFTSTAVSKAEVDFLVDKLNAEFIKVASMDLNNYPFLEYIASKGKPIVLSTGLSTLSEIDMAIQAIESKGNDQIVILHCVAIYPPEDKQVNLRNIDTLAQAYPYPIGFSDHTMGTCVPIAAVAKGACIIEKHFTLDKRMEGWDHKISADFNEMKVISHDSKRVYEALGSARIVRAESEEMLGAFRRSIVAAREIMKDEVITEDMLDFKRPGTGMAPDNVRHIVGKTAKRNIAYDEMILSDDI
ncbi:MAG: N-acetylneuraminate synthase family protein [Candidatus Pacearchaeota archaeon]|nr:N-acetylneuraminate synthase family protein [Candidatus Pacearchaeota archaeon]